MIVGRASIRLVDQRVGALGEIDLGADRHRKHQAGGVLVGMRQRQEREEDLVAEAEFVEKIDRADAVGDDGAVAEHDALRLAAGAGRVDQAGERDRGRSRCRGCAMRRCALGAPAASASSQGVTATRAAIDVARDPPSRSTRLRACDFARGLEERTGQRGRWRRSPSSRRCR